MALVSVLIATYHRPQLLENAIESVINQTHNNIEIIVVNDDINDRHTVRVLNEYEGESLIAVHNDERVGISASRNIAADIANGEFICVLDDDDRWHPQKVEKQLEKFSTICDDYAVVFTGGEVWNVNSSQLIDRRSPSRSREGCVWPDILRSWGMAPHSSHMIRSASFHEVDGFDEDIHRGEDWDLSIRLAKRYKFAFIDEPLTVRLVHGDNVSDSLHVDQRKDILVKHGNDIFSDKSIRQDFFSIWHQKRGYYMMLNGRRREAIQEYYLASGYNPQKRTILLLIASLLGIGFFQFLRRTKDQLTKLKRKDNSKPFNFH